MKNLLKNSIAMKIIFIVIFTILALAFSATAQQVLSPGGNTYHNNQGSISMTLGETFVSQSGTIQSTNGTATIVQGFQQSIGTSIITKVKEVKPEVNSLTLAPNPCVNQLIINSNKPLIYIKVINDMGQEIANKSVPENTSNQTLDVSLLPPGNYMLSIKTNDNKIEVKKFTKQ